MAISGCDQQLIDQWKNEPAPLLPLLHAFHNRDGYLSDDALRAVSEGLKTPLADLYGTVTFYHHFSRTPGGLEAPRVCTGNICCLRGGNESNIGLWTWNGCTPRHGITNEVFSRAG